MPTGTPQQVIRTRYATSDPAEAREFLGQAYGAQLRVGRLHGSRSRLTLDLLQVGQVELADLDLPLDLSVRLPGQGQYVFSTVLGGTSQYERQRDLACLGPGDTHLGIQPDRDDRASTAHLHADTVSLPATLLDEAVALEDQQPTGWSFTAVRPVPGRAAHWRQIVRSVRGLLNDLDDTEAPLIIGPATRLLAATALVTFPNTAVAQPTFQDRHDAQPDTLRRVVAFIEAHPDLDMSLTDMARAAYVTPRAVQLAFRRHLGTTPTAYLRRVRLDHARTELLTATDGHTVTAIAARWGFTPSRFAQQYRDAYGELPSHTLHGPVSARSNPTDEPPPEEQSD